MLQGLMDRSLSGEALPIAKVTGEGGQQHPPLPTFNPRGRALSRQGALGL